jgi:hypothetical protein
MSQVTDTPPGGAAVAPTLTVNTEAGPETLSVLHAERTGMGPVLLVLTETDGKPATCTAICWRGRYWIRQTMPYPPDQAEGWRSRLDPRAAYGDVPALVQDWLTARAQVLL